MRLAHGVLSVVGLLLAACGTSESEPEESARLRKSLERFQKDYRESIAAENRLIGETLRWLESGAVHAPRTEAISEARRLMDRWARVYFVPRHMHQELRPARYSSSKVREVHGRILEELKRRYFELHDYQRYAQYASESEMHGTPAGRLPRQLEEFRLRLYARAPAVDTVGPLLDALARDGV